MNDPRTQTWVIRPTPRTPPRKTELPVKGSRKRTLIALAAGMLVLTVGIVGAVHSFGPDRQLAKVRQLREELMSEAGRNLSSEERRERWKQFGEEMKQLTPEQRNQLGEERRQEYMKKLDHYFTLPKQEQIAQLDREIDRMEAMRKRFEASRAERERSKAASAKTPQASGVSGSPGPSSDGKRSWQSMSGDEKDRRRKDRLDNSTAEERAKTAEYRKQMDVRRQQRGLPPSPFGGGR